MIAYQNKTASLSIEFKYEVRLRFNHVSVPCNDAISLQPKENEFDNVLTFTLDYQYGWVEAIVNGTQFVLPTLDDLQMIVDNCSIKEYHLYETWHYFLQGI